MNWTHFTDLYEGRRIDAAIVCQVEIALAARLGAWRGRILISLDTLEKQKAHHPDLCINDYEALRPAMLMGEWRQDTPRSAVVLFTDCRLFNCSFRAAVKAPAHGGCLYVVSFNRLRDRYLKKEQKKLFPVIWEHQ